MIDIGGMLFGALVLVLMILCKWAGVKFAKLDDTEAWFLTIAIWIGIIMAHINSIENHLGI